MSLIGHWKTTLKNMLANIAQQQRARQCGRTMAEGYVDLFSQSLADVAKDTGDEAIASRLDSLLDGKGYNVELKAWIAEELETYRTRIRENNATDPDFKARFNEYACALRAKDDYYKTHVRNKQDIVGRILAAGDALANLGNVRTIVKQEKQLYESSTPRSVLSDYYKTYVRNKQGIVGRILAAGDALANLGNVRTIVKREKQLYQSSNHP
jgi:hypothetical protein